MNNYKVNCITMSLLGAMRDRSAMEELIDFECCFEALKKASAILTILQSESCSVNEIKPVDQTQAAFDRSLAQKEAHARERQAKEDAVIAAREAEAPKEKEADPVPPAEDKPATKPKGRKPKGSEDAPAEGQDTAPATPPVDAPEKPKEILFWDGENSDHRKVLIMILKEDHQWDSKNSDNLAFASLVKSELQNCQIDHTRQDLIRAKVGEIVADLKAVLAQTKEANVKAPF